MPLERRQAPAHQKNVPALQEALHAAKCAINSMKVAAQGDEQMMLEACETISREGLEASMAIDAALAASALPEIKGAWVDGSYVIVTPAGRGDDKAKAVKAAILAAFPVAPKGGSHA